MQETLYRKYRPKTFDEIRGQDHIVASLSGALDSKQVAHAYLFAGSRGTGKTSVARIFARALETSDKDTYEIDAASNRGIDEIRALREAALFMPFDSKFKVYIVDEAHMLTKDAFNALLKTLEEPPKHVIFILATTELHKMPDTIVSRCQLLQFKKPTVELLQTQLAYVAKEEGYTLDKEALGLLAISGEGSYRNALGVLQQALTLASGKSVTLESVERITGAPSSARIHALVVAIGAKDRESALEILSGLSASNIDALIYLRLLMEHVRRIMLVAFSPKIGESMKAEVSEEDWKSIEKHSGKDAQAWPKLLRELLECYEQVAIAEIKTLPIELALLRFFGQDK